MHHILSLQSWVAYGHVGNAAALFPLQRLGAEVSAIHTVQFSNHTGYGNWTGEALAGSAVQALVNGIAARGVLPRIGAVLSGYIGHPDVADAVLDAVAQTRSANPAALYCCDPVIGDTRPGVYVLPGVLAAIRDRAVPMADILTPNQFELATLAGHPITSLTDALGAVALLRARMRPGATVLVTSLMIDSTPHGMIEVLAAGPSGAWRVTTPRLAIDVNGAGDVTAALFLLHTLRTREVRPALEATAAAIHGLLRHTHASGRRELALVAAQDELVRPSQWFHANEC